MSDKTGIQWTDHTFNPWWGCIRVSPGCEHCYAETFAKRLGLNVWGPAKTTGRRTFAGKHWDAPMRWNAAAKKAGVRARVFCASMADVFEDHPAVEPERRRLWWLIRETPHLDWQLLTKRPENIARMLPADWGQGYPNVWLGTSIESPDYAHRFDVLRAVPAAVHFLSLEPLLGDIAGVLHDRFAELGPGEEWWAILGGESGATARPFELDWVRDALRWCDEFGVSAFVKQLGARPFCANNEDAEQWPGATIPFRDDYEPHHQGELAPLQLNDSHGGDWAEWPADLRVREFPTSRVGLVEEGR